MSERLTDEEVETFRKVHNIKHLGDPITLSLLDEVQASRKLIADLRALHRPDSQNDPWCDEDGFCYPCPTVRMIDEAGL